MTLEILDGIVGLNSLLLACLDSSCQLESGLFKMHSQCICRVYVKFLFFLAWIVVTLEILELGLDDTGMSNCCSSWLGLL